jgi:dolichol-phosphate mannosyltransferase
LSPSIELAIVIPTFKERENIEPILDLMEKALPGIEYEVVFVDDDSPDGTAAAIREIAISNPRVRVLQRIGRRGLSSACLEGMMATPAPYIAVMDGDLQHDEGILPAMLHKLKEKDLDLVVATRNSDVGSMGEFAPRRVRLSHLGRRLSHLVSKADLTDPMSGFFIVNRKFLEEVAHASSGVGFKILLDLVSSSKRPVRFSEVPYTFRRRVHGESKLDVLAGIEYIQLLLDKAVGNWVSPRFLMFGMVGACGVLIFAATLKAMLSIAQTSFLVAQAAASLLAMTFNFFANNLFTYRDRRLRGIALIRGFVTFCAACFIGLMVNIRVAEYLRELNFEWYLAGGIGLVIGSVWNYGVTSIITWRTSRRR